MSRQHQDVEHFPENEAPQIFEIDKIVKPDHVNME